MPKQNQEISQLHRLIGQLKGVEKLIDQKQSVCKILQQIEAVRGNLKSLEKRLIVNEMKQIKNKEVRECIDYLCKIA